MKENLKEITAALSAWYEQNARTLPWRQTLDPYRIWISEIILQQTRVEQGLPYFERFMIFFPNVQALADSSEEKVLNAWQGLGYYSRARNLHAAAKFIATNLQGKFPDNYDDLIQLKGVGPYTAAAIASFAFGEKKAVVDGNVYRVLSRLFDNDLPINEPKGQKAFQQLANELLDAAPDAALHNQAMMEFGALQCTPKKPACLWCPLKKHCLAYQNQTIAERPVKIKKIKKRDRYFNYILFYTKHKEKLVIQQRKEKDIWQQLFQLPLVEWMKGQEGFGKEEARLFFEVPMEKVFQERLISAIKKEFNQKLDDTQLNYLGKKKHLLTHQNLYTKFYGVELPPDILNDFDNEYLVVKEDQWKTFAFPKVIESFLMHFFEK